MHLSTQVSFGFIRQIVVIALTCMVYLEESEYECGIPNLVTISNFLVAIMTLTFIPQLVMMGWYLKHQVLTRSQVAFSKWVKNTMQIFICLLTIFNVYFDLLAIDVARKNQRKAQAIGKEDLASSFSLVKIFQILILHFSMVPRYFMLLWIITFMGDMFPE